MSRENMSQDDLVPYVYQVPGITPPLMVGVNSRGSILLGEMTLSATEPVNWMFRFNQNQDGLSTLDEVLEQARVNAYDIRLDVLAREYVTSAMLADAIAAFDAEIEPGDVPLRMAMIEVLGATPLAGSYTTDIAHSAYRAAEQVKQGTGVRAALVAVARSRIADGMIKP